MNIKALLFSGMLATAAFLTACGGQNEAEETNNKPVAEGGEVEEVETLEIFTTIFPLEDLTKKIGGDYVNVTNLVPVGADAHTYEPTARVMIEAAEGDAFIYNGAGLEGFADALIKAIEGEGVKIVVASEGIDLLEGNHDHGEEAYPHEEDEHGHEEEAHGHEEDEHGDEDAHNHDHDKDPHVWLDPILSITLAENIKNTLVELLPEQEEYFESNFADVKAELTAIDEEFQTMVNEAEKDTFIVSHAGYGYWEERYGIHQIGIAGLSPTNEPSQRQVQNIIELANENQIEYLLFEQNMTPRIAEVVRHEVGAEVEYLHNLEALVDEDVASGEDYFSLMRKNIEALRTALQ